MTDEQINACRKNTDWPADCGHCPGRARCDELVREEAARHLGLEPPEDLPMTQGEWVRAMGDRAEYEVRDEGT